MELEKIEDKIGNLKEYIKEARKWRTPRAEAYEQEMNRRAREDLKPKKRM